MGVLSDCTVLLTDGRTLREADVLFRDNGYIRVGSDGEVSYFPPHMVQRVDYEREEVDL
jgi:hypothetical protein